MLYEVITSVVKDDWEKGLNLLKEVLTRPGIDSEVLQAVKEQQLVSLKRQADDAQAVAMRESQIWHFKDHPRITSYNVCYTKLLRLRVS